MNRILRNFVTSAALASATVGAQAAVLTFEDMLPVATGPNFFLADYKGFKFGTNSIATTAWFYTDDVTVFYTPKSPTHYIATDFSLYTGAAFEATQSITSSVDFVFDGAWFSGEGQIYYQLYNNGSLVHTSGVSSALSDLLPIFVSSGFAGLVDELVIFGKQGFYALDDFTYNSRVPEPTSLALVLLAGVLGVGVSRRRPAKLSAA